MTKIALSVVLVGALAFNACSSSSTPKDAAPTDVASDVPAGVKVTVSGVAAPHPLTPPGADFTMLTVSVVDPVIVLANPNATPLAGGPLDTSNCSPTTGCPWSFDNVDITTISIGLVGILDDARTPASSRLWLKTGTGAGSAASINAVIANPMPITGRQLFAVSKATEASIAAGASAALSDPAIVAGSLETRGFMIGTVLGSLNGTAAPAPVAGAVVSNLDTLMRLAILYPNATFDGFGTATAAHGTFFVLPKAATTSSVVTDWNVTPPVGSALTWPTYKAGTSPGTAFVLLMPAN
jgi:hypothetical protein